MDFGKVFDGALPKPQRAWLEAALTAFGKSVERVSLPNAGNFELCHAAITGGFAPTDIAATVRTLPGVIVGGFCAGRKARELEVSFLDDLAPLNDLVDGRDGFGALLVGLRAAQLRPDRFNEASVRRALVADARRYARASQEILEEATRPLMGLDLRMGDVVSATARAAEDPSVLLVLTPPRSVDGITAGDKRAREFVRWVEPAGTTFKPSKDGAALVERAMTGQALALCVVDAEIARVWPDHIVFAHEHRADDVEFVLCSEPERFRAQAWPRRETKVSPPVWPLIEYDHVITKDSTVAFVPTSKDVALYLRDLWAHKLGATRAESYFLMLVDGRVTSVFGMFFNQLNANRAPVVCETFGFSAATCRYKRMNKLLMMSLVSGEAREFFMAQPGARASLLDLTTFQTTCIATVPETKGNRGLGLKIVERRQLPDGRYYLNFRGLFNSMRFKDCLHKWLAKDALVEIPRHAE